MQSPQKVSAFIFVTGLLFLGACRAETNSNGSNLPDRVANISDNGSVAKDDFRELGKIVNLPFEPDESAVWREFDPNGQNSENRLPVRSGVKLVAVLKFSPEQTAEIIKNAERYNPSVPSAIEVETWFPVELIALSKVSGDQTLKGNSYAPNDFVKSPYANGRVTLITNTDYFVLELTAN
jgi:hypothetical protein